MRIALLSPEAHCDHDYSGISLYARTHAEALAEKGIEVHLFSQPAHGKPEFEKLDNYYVHRTPFEWINGDYYESMQNMCRAFVDTVFAVEDRFGTIDIINMIDWPTFSAGIWAKIGRDKKFIATMFSNEHSRSLNKELSHIGHRIADLECMACEAAEKVVTVSHSLREEVIKHCKLTEEKCITILPGIFTEKYNNEASLAQHEDSFQISGENTVIGYFGVLEYRSGCDILIEGVSQAIQKYPKLKLIIAGDGPAKDDLINLANQKNLGHAVMFTGVAENSLRQKFFRRADMVAIPSRNDPFNMSLLEGWACEKPVIATESSNSGDYIWHEVNGLHIFDRPDSVAWAVEKLCEDPEWRVWLGKNGLVAAQTAFNAGIFTENMENLYKEILA